MDLENTNQTFEREIQKIFDDNTIRDLQTFMQRKDCLNNCNIWIMYIFHVLQSSGIIVTTISAGYNDVNLIWLGVCLNVCASLIHIYEKNNNAMITRLSKEIHLIKEGKYVDESILVDMDDVDPPKMRQKVEPIEENQISEPLNQISDPLDAV